MVEKSYIVSIIVLTMVNIVDSITYSCVGPSLIFYVTDMGGYQNAYGLIVSASWISTLAMTTFYGLWVDGNGYKFHAPYAASFAMGFTGSILYFLAQIFPRGIWAVSAIFMGRLITGMGAAGHTLAYSWIATAIPRDGQRMVLTILSLTRTGGMVIGPFVNFMVAKVDTVWEIFGFAIPVNENNSVGLVVALGEVILFTATFLFLKNPPPKQSVTSTAEPADANVWEAITHFELLISMTNFFFVNFNLTFYAAAIPPVAFHAFGWGTVAVSKVLAAQAAVLFSGMVVAFILSLTKVPDMQLIQAGNVFFTIGGILNYYFWKTESTPLQFVLPILINALAVPLIGPANRSQFTKAVHKRPDLENSHGVMQSMINQAFAMGGLVSPNFATTLILRSQKQLEQDLDNPHELTLWAWFMPISSIAMLLLFQDDESKQLDLLIEESTEEYSDPAMTETSPLVPAQQISKRRRSSLKVINQSFSPQYEVAKRLSIEGSGITNPFETRDEMRLQSILMEDKKAWQELIDLDAEMEEA